MFAELQAAIEKSEARDVKQEEKRAAFLASYTALNNERVELGDKLAESLVKQSDNNAQHQAHTEKWEAMAHQVRPALQHHGDCCVHARMCEPHRECVHQPHRTRPDGTGEAVRDVYTAPCGCVGYLVSGELAAHFVVISVCDKRAHRDFHKGKQRGQEMKLS